MQYKLLVPEFSYFDTFQHLCNLHFSCFFFLRRAKCALEPVFTVLKSENLTTRLARLGRRNQIISDG